MSSSVKPRQTIPETPLTISSEIPPAGVDTTSTPAAIASLIEVGKLSKVELHSRMSAHRRADIGSGLNPMKRIASCASSSAIRRSQARRKSG